MSRLFRFPDNRFIGRRDTMLVYDCDDEDQFEPLAAVTAHLELDRQNLLQSFAPDRLSEALNRGFHSIEPVV
jgi:hypothetical protein